MIRPIARTHEEAAEKAERIKEARKTLRAAEWHSLKENLVYAVFVVVVISGAILLGKLISVIVRQM